MSNPALFKSSRLKISRARRHVSELQGMIRAYIARKPCWVVQEDAGEGAVDWTIRVKTYPPEEIPTVIGDVVHNLRASLDLLACNLVELNGGDAKNVYFPFSNSPDEFEYMLKKRGMLAAAASDVDLLRSMKPYHGGNTSLRALHDLDIVDKHRTLIPVMQATKLPEMRDTNGNVFNMTTNMTDGQKVVRIGKTPSLPIGFKIVASPEFHFEYDAPVRGQIVENLLQLCDLVSDIIDRFEKNR